MGKTRCSKWKGLHLFHQQKTLELLFRSLGVDTLCWNYDLGLGGIIHREIPKSHEQTRQSASNRTTEATQEWSCVMKDIQGSDQIDNYVCGTAHHSSLPKDKTLVTNSKSMANEDTVILQLDVQDKKGYPCLRNQITMQKVREHRPLQLFANMIMKTV